MAGNVCVEAERFPIRLEYAMLTVELNTPSTTNQILDPRTLTRETVGGRLVQVRPTTWNDVEILQYTFTSLSKSQVDNLREFVCVTAGLDITLYDEFEQEWVGVIESPIKIRQVRRSTACEDARVWEVEFSFEGEQV